MEKIYKTMRNTGAASIAVGGRKNALRTGGKDPDAFGGNEA